VPKTYELRERAILFVNSERVMLMFGGESMSVDIGNVRTETLLRAASDLLRVAAERVHVHPSESGSATPDRNL